MPSLTEGILTAEFTKSEAPGWYSRENVTIVSGAGKLPAGRMLGKQTTGGKYHNYNDGLSDGTQTCVGILIAPVDATSSDVLVAILVRNAEVISSLVSSATGGHKAAGIVDLSGVTNMPAAGNILFR